MGFFRQEYWSGLPCPPPADLPDPGIDPVSLMSPALTGGFFTTSTTYNSFSFAVLCLVTQSCPTLCDPMNCSLPLSLGILQARILEWVTMPFSRGSSQPRDRTQLFRIAGRFLPFEPLEKAMTTGRGSLSLLQGIFLTQESNWGLLHCRWILYQLSYQGSPSIYCCCCC